jgi:sugar phosphate isomerase/epimerase
VPRVFIAASTRSLATEPFEAACAQITELEYDKIEIWLDENSSHLKPSHVANDPEQFFAQYRDKCRLSPCAFYLEHDVPTNVFEGLCKAAKLMRITQLTIPAGPLGTPFNTEIDRLREAVRLANIEGVRVSLKTRTGDLTEDPHTAVELCQSVPGLGLTLDPSYYICGPNKNKSYDQVFPYVFHVHLRDTTPEQLQVQIGLGEIDYSRIINQLSHRKFNRALAVDLLAEDPSAPPLNRGLEMRKLRMLLDTLL